MTDYSKYPIDYVLAPKRGRVSKARQVPLVRVSSEKIDAGTTTLDVEIEKAFFKYHSHDVYAGIVDLAGGLFGTVDLFCANTNQQIATIIITKEYANV